MWREEGTRWVYGGFDDIFHALHEEFLNAQRRIKCARARSRPRWQEQAKLWQALEFGISVAPKGALTADDGSRRNVCRQGVQSTHSLVVGAPPRPFRLRFGLVYLRSSRPPIPVAACVSWSHRSTGATRSNLDLLVLQRA